jgi:hypothetical protein
MTASACISTIFSGLDLEFWARTVHYTHRLWLFFLRVKLFYNAFSEGATSE